MLSLFWASWLGELPPKLILLLEEDFFEPLDIETPTFTAEKLADTMAGNVLFPRRIAQYGLNHHSRHARSRGDASVFFLDAAKVEDVVDFWNLRAMGRPVIPVPKQLQDNPQLREIVVEFLKAHRLHWPHNPKVCDFARFVRARNCTLDEMKSYAQTLKIDREPGDSSDYPFFGLQDWYPRIWDEWTREKGREIPDDIYGDVEDEIEATELQVRFRSLLPTFAYKHEYHGEPRCANEIGFRLFGADQYFAEVFPKAAGQNLALAISGIGPLREWRVGRNGLVKLVANAFAETRSIPAAEAIFFAWLTDRGWNPQLSPPGILAKEIYKRLQGNLAVLKNEVFLDLLERMNGGKVKQDISAVEIEQEKELSMGEVKGRLKSAEHRDLHDYLVSSGH
jgi:hypothetical protein